MLILNTLKKKYIKWRLLASKHSVIIKVPKYIYVNGFSLFTNHTRTQRGVQL